MDQDRFLTDAYRRFLDQLRNVERRIMAASQPAAEVESPDPREVRGRLDHALDEITAAAVTEHRDVTSQDFLTALWVMASTADAILGQMTGWDGSATFREPSPERLALDHPVPEGVPDTLVDQILARLGRAASHAGDVVETRGRDDVQSGKMPPDLARLYLLRLWVMPPEQAEEGERSLASLRARLSAQLEQADTESEDVRIFPDAYRRKAAPQSEALLPAVRIWLYAAFAVLVLVVVVGTLEWFDTTATARGQVKTILDAPTAGARPLTAPPGGEAAGATGAG